MSGGGRWKAEGRRQKAEGRRQKAEGRRQKAEAILLCLTLILVAIATTGARAHEIGTTRVTAAVERNTYRIEIVTDAAALAEKLATAEGWSTPATSDAKVLEAFLQRGEPAFRRRVSLRFDNVVSIPAVVIAVIPATDA